MAFKRRPIFGIRSQPATTARPRLRNERFLAQTMHSSFVSNDRGAPDAGKLCNAHLELSLIPRRDYETGVRQLLNNAFRNRFSFLRID